MQILRREKNNTHICFSESKNNSSLFVSEVGYSTPPTGYYPTYFPTTNCYTIHYLTKGRVIHNGRILEAPCIFLLTPEIHTYSVDCSSNFTSIEQYWILFNGTNARTTLRDLGFTNESLSAPCPYIDQAVAIFQELQNPSNYAAKNDGYYMLSGLFSLFALHTAQNNQLQTREISPLVDTIRKYIEKNHATITHEEDISSAINISVSYMNKRFKAEIGCTPIRFLIDHRIKRAKILLKSTHLSIKEISESIGFSNPNYFCLVFKKYCDGISPSAYRKNFQSSKSTEDYTKK